MKSAEIFALCMIITVVSVLGFAVENIWLAVTKGYMDNRNMCLPFLIGYGLAVAAIYLMFGTPISPHFLRKKLFIKSVVLRIIVYNIIVGICVSLGEIILGTLVEKTCGIIWWDYTQLPLHITRYTSVLTSMGFSSMITIFMKSFFVPLYEFFVKMDYDRLRVMACSFMTVMLADFLYNAVCMYKRRRFTQLWCIDTTNTQVYKYIHSH